MEDGPERLVGVARDGEVVPHGHHDVDVGLQRESTEKRRRTEPVRPRIQGEQLLELIDDQQRVGLGPPPARRRRGR